MNRRDLIAAAGAALLLPRQTFAASPADLRGDIAILREALKLHPGLYRYATPAQVAARIDALERAFVAAPSLEACYLLLSRFLATIRCGHSYCNFFNQTKPVAQALFDRPTRLPFRFRWMGSRMIVVGDPEALGLPPGTEIVDVNGVRPREMLARLLPYARADGGNDGKRVALMEMTGGDTIEYFDVFHGLIYGAPTGGAHRLTIRAPDGMRRTLAVPALDLARRRATMAKRDYRGDQPVWDWTMRPDGIAVLTMPGWALYNSKWDWQAWLDDRLDSLRGAKGLIVDLRENEGGQQCGDPLLARLTARDLPFAPTVRKLRFRRTPDALNPYLDTWDDSFRTLGVGTRDLGGGWFEAPGEGDDAVIRPRGKRVALPVAALVGPVNSSATFSFAFRCKTTGVARLFGQTTGGNRRGINGGAYFFVRLSASGIEFDVPLIGFFRLSPEPDAGVAPDVRIAPTVADIAADRDPVMAAAVAWAKRA